MYIAAAAAAPTESKLPSKGFGVASLERLRAQQFAHALPEQPVAPVLQHGERQCALEHGAQRAFVALQPQPEVAFVKTVAGGFCVEAHVVGEHQGINIPVRWGGKREGGRLQRDA